MGRGEEESDEKIKLRQKRERKGMENWKCCYVSGIKNEEQKEGERIKKN